MIASLVLLALGVGVMVLFLLAALRLRRKRIEQIQEPSGREAEEPETEEEDRPPATTRVEPAVAPQRGAPAQTPQAAETPVPTPVAAAPVAAPVAPPTRPAAAPAPAPVAPPKPQPAPPPRAAAPQPMPAAKPAPLPAARPVPEPAPPAPRPVALPVPKPAAAVDTAESHRVASLRAERTRLRAGLQQTRGGFVARLAGLLRGRREIPVDLLSRLEEILFTADIGVKTSHRLLELVRERLSSKQISDADAVMALLRQEAARMLSAPVVPPVAVQAKPHVVLLVGVNGTGKTTTIGKLAARAREEDRRVTLVAGDTFRAAAVDQLEIWAKRVGADFFGAKEGADPSSVIFDGIRSAVAKGADVVLCDTAGRLHTKTGLMEELQKVRRVAGKALAGAPHETLLVLDATTGQNAIAQAQTFKQALEVTGLVLTKLDGTAKGGVVLGVCEELGLPIRYLGIGERVDDLRDFDATVFADALLGDLDDAPAADGAEAAQARN